MTPPPQPTQAQQQQLAAQVATALAVATTVAEVVTILGASFAAFGIYRKALSEALSIVMSHPPALSGAAGPATLNAIRLNDARRGQFVVASAQRMMRAELTAGSRGASKDAALQAAAAAERRYYAQHLTAIWQRVQAGARVDTAAWSYGQLLGWHTVLDSRTSPECRAANGRNFMAASMPIIGYPGAVHPHCRCFPGRPYRGGAMLPAMTPARYATAA